MGKRINMLESSLQRAISAVVQRELQDPRLGFVTITDVRLSPDARQARVFVSVLAGGKDPKESVEVLRHSAGLIKKNIRPLVKTRFMPDLEFIYDETAKKAAKLERLMQQVHTDDDTTDENPEPE